jgi:hypothetical protein
MLDSFMAFISGLAGERDLDGTTQAIQRRVGEVD